TTNVRGWIDFNNDGFFDNEELVMTSYGENVSYGNHSVSFIVPSSATVNTSLRMRISTDFHESPEPQSCGMIEYGQVEDYTVYISPNVSVQDIKQIKLELYPNPTSDILNLSEKVNNIEIYATDGRKVMSFESAEQINVSSLPVGTYIIKAINSANKKAQGTFIKK
ncbi:MAG TPA: GEVED domain-containing protein, partial [Flavobacterium sp.]|nr:GEVED domain-containing protein [Flavobacterium sp.]